MQTSRDKDLECLRHAITLARQALKAGNLPIGTVITLNDKIIAEGQNSIWHPTYRLDRHAEIVALEAVPTELWQRASNMTLYTTLEPCLMCLGAILLHRVGRVIFGSEDRHGGALCVCDHLPPAFKQRFRPDDWIGPALPQECDPLKKTVIAMALSHRKKGSSIWDKLIEANEDPAQA